MPGKEWTSVAEAAKMLAVSKDTVRLWCRQGRLKAFRVGERLIRISVESIDQLTERNSMQISSRRLDYETDRYQRRLASNRQQ